MISIRQECNNGDIEWRNSSGQYHREDGPAIEDISGTKLWIQNGKYHRLDGPACEYFDGYKVWYVDGEHIDCTSQEEFDQLMRLRAFW